jgi:Na+/proline symporter
VSDGHDPRRSRAPETRAVWWLLGGIVLLAVVIVLLAPELLGDLRGLGSLALVVIAAGLPGLLIVLVVAARRRRARARGDLPDDRASGPHRPDAGA